MSAAGQLDRERIEQLATAIMKPIVANSKRGPSHPDRVYEGLSAVAAAAALLLHSTGLDDAAVGFFMASIEANIEANREAGMAQ